MSYSSSAVNGWLKIYQYYTLGTIMHIIRDAIMTPPSRYISSAAAGSPVLLTIENHGLLDGDTVTIAGCAGGTFTTLNGTAKTVTVIDDDTLSVGIVATGTYTEGSGSVTATTLPVWVSSNFPGSSLKMFIGIDPNDPPAASDYPAIFVTPTNWGRETDSYDSSKNIRSIIIGCLLSDTTSTTVSSVTESAGLAKIDRFCQIVLEYLRRGLMHPFIKRYTLRNDGLLYYPLFHAGIEMEITY